MKSHGWMLDVSDLSVKLRGVQILENVSIRIGKGVTVAIIGPNGAGKTTLFKALLKLVPYKGKITWNKKVKIGYVPQNLSISGMPLSVREFLLFKHAENIEETLELVGLGNEVLDKRLDVLSGGEFQKVLIAWAIIDKPDILLFDEPTTGVDVGSEEIIYEMLNRLERETGMTILLITHSLHVIKHYSDYVLALDKDVTFFGESRKISEPSLLNDIYGSHSLFEHHRHGA